MGHTKLGRLRRKCSRTLCKQKAKRSVAGQQCRNTEGLKWKCTLCKQESHQNPKDDVPYSCYVQMILRNPYFIKPSLWNRHTHIQWHPLEQALICKVGTLQLTRTGLGFLKIHRCLVVLHMRSRRQNAIENPHKAAKVHPSLQRRSILNNNLENINTGYQQICTILDYSLNLSPQCCDIVNITFPSYRRRN